MFLVGRSGTSEVFNSLGFREQLLLGDDSKAARKKKTVSKFAGSCFDGIVERPEGD